MHSQFESFAEIGFFEETPEAVLWKIDRYEKLRTAASREGKDQEPDSAYHVGNKKTPGLPGLRVKTSIFLSG